MKLVAPVKLLASPEQVALLEQTLQQANATCNFLAVIAVDPRYTSQTCPVCGYVARGNRRTQALFSCMACGYSAPADHNAAQNIRARALVNGPMVSTPPRGEGQAPPLAVG